MITAITTKQEWKNTIESFRNNDIYYTYDYCKSFQLHGDGEPKLIYYTNNNFKLCLPIMINDISSSLNFNDLQPNSFFDATTPYGYGGPLIDGEILPHEIDQFYKELFDFSIMNKIISLFIRFHPLLANQSYVNSSVTIIHPKNTVFIDTTTESIILDNMTGKCRNMVNKAKKNNVIIEYDHGENIDILKSIYNQTMDNHVADSYYYFKNEYYQYLIDNLKPNLIIFYAYLDSVPIGASMFLYNENFIHYHLSGTLYEYRNYASSNLILASAAQWASKKGIKKFHLGGGVQNEDNLFNFKKSFNKNGIIPYYIGKIIFDLERYNYLLHLRQEKDSSFDINNNNLIQYRK
ncbi:MAG: peptidoglycan bridge formation glycyltransferase FemA/FemB family protein [Erysipelotrichales bacterium]|nr:peptidoglycan bridge formation glycyltransferase FemA/FemB family protein [Erysipelotrichales bacterium]